MKFDFDGIQAFVAIADLGGFHRAAEQLHLTQTALTRRLQKLEAALDTRLVERTTRRVSLTPAGRDFLPRARSLVEDMRAAVADVKSGHQRSRGVLRVASIPSLTSHILPQVIQRFAQQAPEVRLRIFDGTSDEVRDAVRSGQAELGVALRGERSSDLIETALFADPLVLLCPTPHPLQHRRSVTWEDMRGVRLIGASNFTATRVFMDYQLAKRGVQVSPDVEVRHHATAINLVAAGVGCSILPASTFREGDRPGVRCIPLTEPVVRRHVVLVRPATSELSPAASAILALFREINVAGIIASPNRQRRKD